MREYRIMQQGDTFFPMYRGFFLWKCFWREHEDDGGYYRPIKYTVKFSSLEKARDFLAEKVEEDKKAERNKLVKFHPYP